MAATPAINRASLSEQAYIAIKRMIVRLELMPDQPITEAELSAMLNISKSPIRSALIHLQRDGLVTFTPYRETIVSGLSVKYVRGIYEARMLIEPYVVKAVTPLLTPEDHASIQDMLDRSARALDAEDYDTFFQINTEFHGFFVRRHGNELFWESFQAIDAQMERIRMISATITNHPRKQLVEHRAIYEAIREGNAVRAEAEMHAHILGYLDDVLAELEARRVRWVKHDETRKTAKL